MSNIQTTGETKVYIGTSVACVTNAEFAADTWTEVKEVTDVGEIGDSTEIVPFLAIGDNRVRKIKGASDGGEVELTVGRDYADAGQILLRAAVSAKTHRNFKVVLADAPASGTPSIIYFASLVGSGKTVFGSANDVTRQTFSLSITGEILGVVAAPAAG